MRHHFYAAIVAACFSVLPACNMNRLIMARAVEAQVAFFHHEASDTGLERLAPQVYTFAFESDRGIVVVTSEGLVVSDTFNQRYVDALLGALEAEGVEARVNTIIYSHHHLDHVGGGRSLEAPHVLAHRDVPRYWANANASDAAAPTQFTDGTQTIEIGGVRFELIDTSDAHSETLLALYLPESRILYAPDTLTPGVFQLGWTPEVPIDGYLRTIDTLAQLPFETFVASHMGYAQRAGFQKTVEMQRDVVETAKRLFDARDISNVYLHYDAKIAPDGFLEFYDELHARYGDWHGFDQNILPIFIRLYTTELLGDVLPEQST